MEVDITQKLCEAITIKDREGRLIKQPVEFEWKPPYCEDCHKIGYKCNKQNPTKAVKEWKEKHSPKPQVEDPKLESAKENET